MMAVFPPSVIHYSCVCPASVASKLCKQPIPLKLKGGWVVQPANCINHQNYILTAGATYFSGKKVFAIYDNLKSPLSESGYVYHVEPNLAFTQKNYSLTVVTHSAIHGIDVNAKNHSWQCGFGNGSVSCDAKFTSAYCYDSQKRCHFLYLQK